MGGLEDFGSLTAPSPMSEDACAQSSKRTAVAQGTLGAMGDFGWTSSTALGPMSEDAST